MNTKHQNLIAAGHALAKEITGVPAALVKELTDQLEVQRVRADVLMKERDDARTELSSAMLTISQITEVVGTSDTLSISQQVAEMANKFHALAADNAGLKDINAWCKTDAFKNMYREFKTAEALGCPDVDCMHDAMLAAIMHAPSTPATDAFLAKVRAQGVEMFAERLQLFIDDGYFESNELGLIFGAVDCGKELSAQLRKEAGNGSN